MDDTPLRLDKLLSNRGYCTRKEVAGLLREERVRHKDNAPLKFDSKVIPSEILVDDEPLDPSELLLVLNKPCGYVCSRSGNEGPTIFELLPERWSARNPMLSPVGRLDKDTSGLLLLTDNGELLHKLTSPKHGVEKEYLVELRDPLSGEEKAIFAAGTLELDGALLKPARLKVHDERKCTLIITEGKFHQVRRMFELVGNEVLSLKRVRVGALTLKDLPEGEWSVLPDAAALS